MGIKYLHGDVTKPVENGKKILIHVVNNCGGWGAGVVLAISRKWKLPEKKYREWHKLDNNFKMGEVQFVKVNDDLTIANMLAQDGFGGVAVKYDALRTCIKKVCSYAKKEKACIVAPKFGAGLAGGDWKVIEKIVEEELCDKGIEVTIYEFV